MGGRSLPGRRLVCKRGACSKDAKSVLIIPPSIPCLLCLLREERHRRTVYEQWQTTIILLAWDLQHGFFNPPFLPSSFTSPRLFFSVPFLSPKFALNSREGEVGGGGGRRRERSENGELSRRGRSHRTETTSPPPSVSFFCLLASSSLPFFVPLPP